MKSTGHEYNRFIVGTFLAVVALLCACFVLSACNNDDTVKKYTISYNFNGGHADESYSGETFITVNNSAAYYLPQAIKEGYRFCGWYDNAEFTGDSITVITTKNTRNYLLYAKFLLLYHATYFVYDGFHTNKTEYTVEDNITLKSAAKTGYSFLGWYDNPNFLGSSIQAIHDMDCDIDLYAKFSLLHNIEYDLQGGINSVDNPRAFCEDEQIILNDPAKHGHSFLGWYLDGQLVSTIQFGTTNDVVLQARWEIANYKLAWDLRGGTSPATYPSQYTYGVGISEASFVFPTKTDMVFAGWYVDSDDKAKYVKSISETDVGDKIIYAKWVNAACVNNVPQWNFSITTDSANGNVKNERAALTVSVPDELLDICNDGRLGIDISATLYSNVRSQGNATASATSYFIVNGNEYEVSSASAKGGGYSYWNGFWTVPKDGDWGYSGYQTKKVSFKLDSTKITVGYRYYLSSDKSNKDVNISLSYGCTNLTCRFYVV